MVCINILHSPFHSAQYLVFIGKRASGELQTTAAWIRSFVDRHPDYKHDSVVPQSVAYDLLKTCTKITNGDLCVPSLLGKLYPLPNDIPGSMNSPLLTSSSSSSSSVPSAQLKAFPTRKPETDTDTSYWCEKCGLRHSKHTTSK